MVTKSKILVVDDDPLLLDLLLETLKTIGYDPVGASSGDEALSLLDRNSIDLVITDIKMPGMNGIELARRVRTINHDIPVIFITGVYDPDHLQKFEADGFLAKPFRINQIEQLIEQTMCKKTDSDRDHPTYDILVVDDDDSFRLMLVEALKLFGYKPFGASGRADAMRLLRIHNFAVVVADIKLAHVERSEESDGRELAREIKNNYPEIGIILITAYLQDDQKQSNVVEAILLKPFKIEGLIDILERLSDKRKSSVGRKG